MENTLIAMIIGAIVIYVGYNLYAKRIDRNVIQADPKRVTPARMYMDGVDFVPTSRNILYGYHFKSIAAAGPIVGAITAAGLWGWLPSLLWLILGVTFIGWASDYSAIVVAVRNDGNSMSATAYRLIAPRTRQILLVFIFFYLLLIASAFGNLVAGVLTNPTVPFGIITIAVMGALAGQMLYRWKRDLVLTTFIAVGATLAAVLIGADANGVVASFFKGVNSAVDSITGGTPVVAVLDPTRPADQQMVNIMPSFIFWLLAMFAFCYFGAILPIWRYAQPVIYIAFWITALTMFFGLLGAGIAGLLVLAGDARFAPLAAFKISAFTGFMAPVSGGAIQPLWPMLFVTIACGAISGWHALIGSIGTARQIENEEDMLPVGGGAMFTEFALGLLALLAVTAANQPGTAVAKFTAGVGGFLSVFGIPVSFGTAFANAAFVLIVITVVLLVFRVMRVTMSEGLGDRAPLFRSVHFGTLVSMAATLLLVVSGTYIYIWQLFGAANQLMASLSLLIVTVWLASTRRSPAYAGLPFLFMYCTTIAAALVTAYNLAATVLLRSPYAIAVVGSGITIMIALLLVVAALAIGLDGLRAYRRYRQEAVAAAPAPANP